MLWSSVPAEVTLNVHLCMKWQLVFALWFHTDGDKDGGETEETRVCLCARVCECVNRKLIHGRLGDALEG